VQPNLDSQLSARRMKADLGQSTLQWHLTALESDLVKAAGTGCLTLTAAASRLSTARGNAATDSFGRSLCSACRLHRIQSHLLFLNLEQVGDLGDHAAILRRVGDGHRLMHATKA
jgi:hypothetical protein